MSRAEKYERTKARLVALGYRLDVARDGTQRLYRPDGTLAVLSQPSGPLRGLIDAPSEIDRV